MKKIIKRKNGLTLLESLLIVGLIAVSSIGVYVTYMKSAVAAKVSQEAGNIKIIQDGILNIYSNERNFQNLDNTLVNNSSIAPNSMRDGTPDGIHHVFGSDITITSRASIPSRPNDTMVITYNNVPSEYCTKFVVEAKNKFDSVVVNGTTISNDGIIDTTDLVPALCDNGGNSTLEFLTVNYSTLGGGAAIDPPFNSVKPIYSTPLN
jgi:type II secretory pathway pseudopilin PulG